MNMTDRQRMRFQELFANASPANWKVGSDRPTADYSANCIYDVFGNPVLDVTGAGTAGDAELAAACMNYVWLMMAGKA